MKTKLSIIRDSIYGRRPMCQVIIYLNSKFIIVFIMRYCDMLL